MMHHLVELAPARSSRLVRQLFFCIGLAMVMLLASPSAFAQTPSDPSRPDQPGISGQPPGPLKEEFVRPQPPPSPVLPIVPLPPETVEPVQPGAVRVFVREIIINGNTVFSDAEIAEVTAP